MLEDNLPLTLIVSAIITVVVAAIVFISGRIRNGRNGQPKVSARFDAVYALVAGVLAGGGTLVIAVSG